MVDRLLSKSVNRCMTKLVLLRCNVDKEPTTVQSLSITRPIDEPISCIGVLPLQCYRNTGEELFTGAEMTQECLHHQS